MDSELSQNAVIAQMLSPNSDEGGIANGKERWLRTDEYTEGVRSLEMERKCLRSARKDIYYWKWVLISIHGAIQAYIVIALKGTAGFDVMTNKSVEKWHKSHYGSAREGHQYPELRTDTFLNLFDKVKSVWIRDVKGGCPERVSDSIKRMHEEFRNKFVHFQPMSWSIEISGMPRILLDCLEVVDFCGWYCADTTWYDEHVKENARNELEGLRRELKSMQKKYS